MPSHLWTCWRELGQLWLVYEIGCIILNMPFNSTQPNTHIRDIQLLGRAVYRWPKMNSQTGRSALLTHLGQVVVRIEYWTRRQDHQRTMESIAGTSRGLPNANSCRSKRRCLWQDFLTLSRFLFVCQTQLTN